MNDGGPAFPSSHVIREPDRPFTIGDVMPIDGMTLRDWFAGQALVGLLSKLPVIDQHGTMGLQVADKIAYNKDVAESCYWIADAMISAKFAALEKEGK